MFVTIALLVIFVACVAVTYTEGLWSNAIRLVNVLIAALLATNFFEPVARFLEGFMPDYKYYWDFPALWVLFAVFMMLMQTATNQVSQVKVRFLKVADQVGGGVFAVLTGWVVVCFTLMTFHAAPLAKNFLVESFQPRQQMFFGLAPDRKWIAFTRAMSRGPLARSATAEEQANHANIFDPDRQFVYRYEQRRTEVEKERVASNASPTGTPAK